MHHTPERRRATSRILLAIALLAIATTCALPTHDSAAGSTTAPVRHRVGAATRFGHVAVFPAGTPARAIEAWREQVLANVHVEGCRHGRACVARLLRLAAVGQSQAEVLAFDLSPDIPADEREALLAVAALASPHAALHDDTTALLATGD